MMAHEEIKTSGSLKPLRCAITVVEATFNINVIEDIINNTNRIFDRNEFSLRKMYLIPRIMRIASDIARTMLMI
jgi:hypothetical protein